MELELIPCLIDRNRDKLHVQVPEHEIPILIAGNPRDSVQKVPNVTEFFVEDFDKDAGAEFDRLVRKYNRLNAPNPVLAVYRGPHELEKFGFVSTGKAVEEAPRSSVEDLRKKVSKPKAKAEK